MIDVYIPNRQVQNRERLSDKILGATLLEWCEGFLGLLQEPYRIHLTDDYKGAIKTIIPSAKKRALALDPSFPLRSSRLAKELAFRMRARICGDFFSAHEPPQEKRMKKNNCFYFQSGKKGAAKAISLSRVESCSLEMGFSLEQLCALARVGIRSQEWQHPFHRRLKNIKLLVSDMDGIWTDAGIYYSAKGEELKKFNTLDGMGIGFLPKLGIDFAVITGENTEMVRLRAKKLGIKHLYQDIDDKLSCFETLIEKIGCQADQVAYIGDDVNDLAVMKRVGFAATVPNAVGEILEVSHYVTRRQGGLGALRDLIDLLALARNQETI